MEVDKACCICNKDLPAELVHEVYSYLDQEDIRKSYCKLMCKDCYESPVNRDIKTSLGRLSLLSRTTNSIITTYKQAYTDYLNKIKEREILD